MGDFTHSSTLISLLKAFDAEEKNLVVICHSPIGLVTAFSDSAGQAVEVDTVEVMKPSIELKLFPSGPKNDFT